MPENRSDEHRETGPRGLTRGSIAILAGVIGSLAAFAVLYLGYLAPDFGGAEMSGHGTFAMILGAIFSLLIGIGLMALVFLSSRRGYDDRVDDRRR